MYILRENEYYIIFFSQLQKVLSLSNISIFLSFKYLFILKITSKNTYKMSYYQRHSYIPYQEERYNFYSRSAGLDISTRLLKIEKNIIEMFQTNKFNLENASKEMLISAYKDLSLDVNSISNDIFHKLLEEYSSLTS